MTPEQIADTKGHPAMTNLFTLADARNHHACKDGYARFEAALRKAYPDVTDLNTILWSIGDVANTDLNDALWCLRLVDDRRTRVAAVMPAVKRASAHTTDERVHWAIGQIDLWLAGDDSVDLGAAEAAARVAADAADAAAWAAVAGEDAVWDAAEAAAWAARDAARAAAWAARDAARAAARAAAWAAAWAAEAATWAARAARARSTEHAHQKADLLKAFPPTFLAREQRQ